MKILDLDMDYFMDSVAHTPDSVLERLSERIMGIVSGVNEESAVFSKKIWAYQKKENCRVG